jgi:hypothetical protein
MGLNMKKQAVTREYKSRYQRAAKKAKSVTLDAFTRLTGYHQKSDVRLLNDKPLRAVLVCGEGKAVNCKPEKTACEPQRKANPRCGYRLPLPALGVLLVQGWKNPRPFMRQQMQFTARRTDFHLTEETPEKRETISPASIDPVSQKSPTKPWIT